MPILSQSVFFDTEFFEVLGFVGDSFGGVIKTFSIL